MSESKIISALPEYVSWYLISFIPIYLPFNEKTLLVNGWRRFDFEYHTTAKKEILEMKVPNGVIILVRDYLIFLNLVKLYPHLNFEFEKQSGHRDLEKICGLPWDELVTKKRIEIQCKTNDLLEQECKDDTWVLPSEIGELRRLRQFGIVESTCIGYPASMKNLRSLKELWNVENYYRNDLPECIGGMSRLEKLTWEVNYEVSDDIVKCKFLRELYLYCDGKTYIPDLSKLKMLEVLTINNMKWWNRTIPSWICKCVNLKELVLQDGNAEILPRNLSKLTLDFLSLSGNKIEVIPEWFFLTQASHINLANNEIEVIPDNFLRLDECVDYVTIYGNPLRVIPERIDLLRKRVCFWLNDEDGNNSTHLCTQDIEMLEGTGGYGF